MINLESCVLNCFYRLTGLYASILKRQGHQSISSLVKGTLWGNCKSVLDHFNCTKAMTRGIEAIAFVASVKYQAWILFMIVHFTASVIQLDKKKKTNHYVKHFAHRSVCWQHTQNKFWSIKAILNFGFKLNFGTGNTTMRNDLFFLVVWVTTAY